jgi:hypothetical protein
MRTANSFTRKVADERIAGLFADGAEILRDTEAGPAGESRNA